MGYRCLTAEECKNLNVNKTSDPPFIPFKTSGKCQEGCPQDYQVEFENFLISPLYESRYEFKLKLTNYF